MYILYKTFSLERPKWREKIDSKIGENLSLNLGGSCARFRFQIWGVEATGASAHHTGSVSMGVATHC